MSSLFNTNECPECSSKLLQWHCTQVTKSPIPDGRLRLHEVDTLFYLSCEYCSHTLEEITGDAVALILPIGMLKT